MSAQPNPYVGPRSFETGEALYGRDHEQRALSALLVAERIVLLHSPSGAGKTSLVKAGLLPRMREENFEVLPVVRVNIEPPAGSANRYLFSTMLSLEEGFEAAERLPAAELAALSLDEYLNRRTDGRDALLIFDQFEEVLNIAPSDREGKQEFFNQVGAALRNKKRWALVSMREDYLGALAPYVRPIPNRLVTRFRLDLLGSEAAIEAIQKPARSAGVNFYDQAAKKLVDDLRRIQVQLPDGTMETQLGPYVEPVQLQVVCFRLWEHKDPDDMDLSEKDLESVGDVNQSLADYYAASVSKTAEAGGTPERSIREWFERKLITPEGLRGQVRMGVEQSEGLPNPVVRNLEDAHIIRSEKRAGQTWVELAHDRLIEPVRANNAKWFEANLNLFQRQAALWLEQGRSEGLLLRGAALDQAEEETGKIAPTQDEAAFLEACRALRKRDARDRNQKRAIVAGLAASLVLFFVAVYFSISANRANQGFVQQASTAQAASTEAIAQQGTAQAASTQAIAQQGTAQAASTEAIAQKAAAWAANTQAVANLNAAATARAVVLEEKNKADEQKRLALEQKKQADANALVAQSLLAQIRGKDDLAGLLAAAAFQVADTARTRTQLIGLVSTRIGLTLNQNPNTGITPDLAFILNGTGLVSSNFFNCEKNNYYLCSEGVLKVWQLVGDLKPGGGNLLRMRQDTTKPILPPGMLDAIAVSADGQTLATAACDPLNNNTAKCERVNINLWDLQTHQTVGQTMSYAGDISNEKSVRLAFSPDGKALALAVNNPTVFNQSVFSPAMLIMWDLETYKEMARAPNGAGAAQMTFSTDSRTLAFASESGIRLLDAETLKENGKLALPGGKAAFSAAFSADGVLIATGWDDGRIVLWNAQTLKVTGQPMEHNSRVTSLALSPDGKVLAAGYYDAGVILWDVESQQRLTRVLYNHVNPVSDTFPVFRVAFSPDSKILASAGNEIILWTLDGDWWVYRACQLARRNFTGAEWELYFQGEEYRQTCSQFAAGGV